MNIIITILIILAISKAICWTTSKIRFPHVVGMIISGIIVGIQPLRDIIIGSNLKTIFSLGDIGLFCLMFLAGMKSSLREIKKEEKDETIIAVYAALIPFMLGFLIFKLLGFSTLISIIVGVCMTITSEATKAKELIEVKKIKSRVGSAMLASGIVDDLIGLTIFLAATTLLAEVHVIEYTLLFGVLLSYVMGMIVQRRIKEHHRAKKIEKVFNLIIPFFFITMGIYFSFEALTLNPTMLILIILLATLGKFISLFAAKPFTSFKWKQISLIGWGMNSRGAMEIAIAIIALRNNLIPIDIYSSIVIMTLITTIMFPFVMNSMLKKHPRIMN